jgi:hypothetical protein
LKYTTWYRHLRMLCIRSHVDKVYAQETWISCDWWVHIFIQFESSTRAHALTAQSANWADTWHCKWPDSSHWQHPRFNSSLSYRPLLKCSFTLFLTSQAHYVSTPKFKTSCFSLGANSKTVRFLHKYQTCPFPIQISNSSTHFLKFPKLSLPLPLQSYRFVFFSFQTWKKSIFNLQAQLLRILHNRESAK